MSRLFDHPGPLWWLWSFFAMVAICVTLGGVGVIVLLGLPFGLKRHRVSQLIHGWCAMCLRMARTRVVVEGQENYDSRQPVLVVSNHQSLLDIPVSYAAFSGDMRMLAKRELSWIPFFGWGMWAAEFVFINRGNESSRRKAARRITDKIQGGLQVWVAPEGTRSKTRELLPFKPGSFGIAIEAGVPVQPLVIFNTGEILHKTYWLLRPGHTVYARILPRVPTQTLKLSDRKVLSERVHGEMTRALASYAQISSSPSA